MLCLSPFSEDKPHARFFFFQCSVHPADCAADRAAAVHGEYGMLPHDILPELGRMFAEHQR